MLARGPLRGVQTGDVDPPRRPPAPRGLRRDGRRVGATAL